jgi:amidase
VIDSINGHETCAETRKVVEDTAKLLESLGHRVEAMPLPIPKTFIADFTLYWSMLAFLLGTFGRFVLAPDFDAAKLDPFSRGLVDHYKKHILSTPMMLYRLYRSAELYAQVLKEYDAVLSPVLGHTVPKLGHLNPETPFETLFERLTQYVAFTPLNNAAGSPAISLPVGMSKAGLPIAVQFQSAHGDERTLLEIAFLIEGAKPFARIQAS